MYGMVVKRRRQRKMRRACVNVRRCALALLAGFVAVTFPADRLTGQNPPPDEPAGEVETLDRTVPGIRTGGDFDADRRLLNFVIEAGRTADRGDHARAVDALEQVLVRKPELMDVRPKWSTTAFPDQSWQGHQTLERTIWGMLHARPETLEFYRQRADGDALAELNDPERRSPGSAGEVVRRFFATSHGEPAASRLAHHLFDRGEYSSAARLLERVLTEIPETATSRGSLLLRLAACQARMGDAIAARETLDQAVNRADARLSRRSVALLERDLDRFAGRIAAEEPLEAWRIPLGNSSRTGRMADVPDVQSPDELTESFVVGFDARLTWKPGKFGTSRNTASQTESFESKLNVDAGDSEIRHIQSWREFGWRPTGGLLFDDGRIFFKGGERIYCCDADDGRLLWMGLRTSFPFDPLSFAYAQSGTTPPDERRPASIEEVQKFGDLVQSSMSTHNGVVYNLEGEFAGYDAAPRTVVATPTAQQVFGVRGVNLSALRREKRNHLAAYDVSTGRLRWRRAANDRNDDSVAAGFLGAPVERDGVLFVPVTNRGEIWVYALHATDGNTLWKRFVCGEPPAGCSPWTRISLAVDQGDVYIATGAGVVAALEAKTGRIHWAVRYDRTGIRDVPVNRSAPTAVAGRSLPGFECDLVIAAGRRLIVTPSDAKSLFALDRPTGRLLWNAPRTPFRETPAPDYCLGVLGDLVYVAGTNVVACYEVATGRLRWTETIPEATGRGLLTNEAIHTPVALENNEPAVLRLDPETGEELGRSRLVSSIAAPLGNLYSDGRRLLAVGGSRVYALAPLSQRLQELADRVDAGDVQAHIERMRLRHRQGDVAGAVDDVRSAYRALAESERRAEGERVLYEGLRRLNLARHEPALALELLTETVPRTGAAHEQKPPEPPSAQPTPTVRSGANAERDSLLLEALTSIAQEPSPAANSVEAILATAPLLNQRYLVSAAVRATLHAAKQRDAVTVQTALENNDEDVRIIGLAGIEGALGESAGDAFVALLQDGAEVVRLRAAVGAANHERREALATLLDLLNSRDPDVRRHSIDVLRQLTGEHFNFPPFGSPPERRFATASWRSWVAREGATTKLQIPLPELQLEYGRILYAVQSRGKVEEVDATGRVTWSQAVPGAFACVGLPDGGRIVSSVVSASRSIIEYDAAGKEVRQITGLPGTPYSIQKLPDGNLVVACYSSKTVVEYRPDDTVALTRKMQNNAAPTSAQRLKDDNMLVCDYSGKQVVEINRVGEVMRKFQNMGRVYAAERLPNGNTLIARNSPSAVIEVDPKDQIVWRFDNKLILYDVQRLPNGNTLIVDAARIAEIAYDGTVVRTIPAAGARRAHSY